MKYYKFVSKYRHPEFKDYVTALPENAVEALGDALTNVFDVTEITEEEYNMCLLSGDFSKFGPVTDD